MAIQLISGNLQLRGNNGQYETDPSTWGGETFGVRSNEFAYSGNYSLKLSGFNLDLVLNPFKVFTIGKFNPVAGKKYLFRAYVRGRSDFPIGTANVSIYLASGLNAPISSIVAKPANINSQWYLIQSVYDENTNHGEGNISINLADDILIGELINPDAIVYVDRFEVYEWSDTEDPGDPPPVPDPTPENAYLSVNPIVFTKGAAAGWDALDNYRLFVDVRVQETSGGTFNSFLKYPLTPDQNDQATFRLNEAFRGLLNATPPSYQQNEIVRLTDRIKFFKVFSGSITGDEVVPVSYTEEQSNVVLLGGINKVRYPGLNYLSNYVSTNKKFLTWAPDFKKVGNNQEDYLNFFVYNNTITQVKLEITAYYTDDSSQTAITKTLTNTERWWLLQIPTGPVNSGVKLINPGKVVKSYKLRLLNQANAVISEERNFDIELINHPLEKFYMFLNSLGAYEVLRFIGQTQRKTEFKRETVRKFLQPNYSANEGEIENAKPILQEAATLNSGFITGKNAVAWADYMKDFLLSRKVYEVNTNVRIPVIVTQADYETGTDQDFRRSASIQVKRAYLEESYTPDAL